MKANKRDREERWGGQDTENEDRKEVGAFYMYVQGHVNIMKCKSHSEQPANQPPFLLTAAQGL